MTPPLRIVFAGTPEFAVPALAALHDAGHTIVAVYTQPDRPAGRGRELATSPVKRRALELGLARRAAAHAQDRRRAGSACAALAPDVMVVVAYGLLLPQAILDIPRLGCLNIHASLLPRWRGAAPIQRAVLAGDAMTGISIMLMDAGLDTGPELLRREVAIGARETAGELHDRLAPLGAAAIVEAVAGWASGQLQPRPQPDAGMTYAAKIRKEESRIDWAQPAVVIDRQVRAFNPWPVAETRLGGRAGPYLAGGARDRNDCSGRPARHCPASARGPPVRGDGRRRARVAGTAISGTQGAQGARRAEFPLPAGRLL